MATNPTVEGEATAMYLAKLIAAGHPHPPGWPTDCRWAPAWNTRTRPPVQGPVGPGASFKNRFPLTSARRGAYTVVPSPQKRRWRKCRSRGK